MPEENRDTFEYFVRWLYFGRPREKTPVDDVSACIAKINQIVDRYVLGDKIGCKGLEEDMVKDLYYLIEPETFSFPHLSVEHICGAPTTVVPLRRMTAAFFAWKVGAERMENDEGVNKLLKRKPKLADDLLEEGCVRYGTDDATDQHFLENE